MATEAFSGGLTGLMHLALGLRTAIMCAEAVWWRCHRGLIADVLRWLGFDVRHIMGGRLQRPPSLYPGGRIVAGRLSYGETSP